MNNKFSVKTIFEYMLGLILVISNFIYLYALPWNNSGIWPEAENSNIALYFVSFLAISFLFINILLNNFKFDIKYQKIIVVALFLILFSYIINSSLYAVSFDNYNFLIRVSNITSFGNPQHGFGTSTYVSIISLLFCYYYMNQTKWRNILIYSSFVSSLLLCVIYTFPQIVGVPLTFSEWVIIPVLLSVAGLFFLEKNKKFNLILGAFIFIYGLYVSENRTAILAILGMLFGFVFIKTQFGFFFVKTNIRRFFFAIFISVFSFITLTISGPIIENYYVSKVDVKNINDGIPSLNPIDHINIQETPLGTIWSRSNMIKVVLLEVKENPLMLLYGNLNGSFNELAYKHARDIDGRLFSMAIPTASKSYWDGTEKANFHSHNFISESLLTSGIFGVIFSLFFVGAIASISLESFIFSIGYIIIFSLWFPFAHFVPLMAFIISILPSSNKLSSISRENSTFLFKIITIIFFVTLIFNPLYSFIVSFNVAKYGHEIRQIKTMTENNCEIMRKDEINMKFDGYPIDSYNVDFYSMFIRGVMSRPDVKAAVYEKKDNIQTFSCLLRKYWEEDNNSVALYQSLEGRKYLSSIGKDVENIIPIDIVNWQKDITSYIHFANTRTDVIIPYIRYIMNTNVDKNVVLNNINAMEKLAPNTFDPVHNWLEATKARLNGNEQQAALNMKMALMLGFANIVPTSREDIANVFNYSSEKK